MSNAAASAGGASGASSTTALSSAPPPPASGASGAGSGASGAPLSEAAVVREFQKKMENRRLLVAKIGELEMELSEHRRVGELLTPMEASRRAYQLVNGVLVESSVGEVRPTVEKNRAGLAELVVKLQAQLKEVAADANAFQERHKISLRPNEATLPALAGDGEEAAAARSALAL
jgi:prefoldin subunit 2